MRKIAKKIHNYIKRNTDLLIEIVFGLVLTFLIMISFGIYFSYFTGEHIKSYLNWKFYISVFCLYVVGYQLFFEFLKCSKPNQLILGLIVVLINFIAFTYFSNLVNRRLYYAVGGEFIPSKELGVRLVLIQYAMINLIIVSFAGISATLKNMFMTLALKKTNSHLWLLGSMILALCSSYLALNSTRIYIFDKQIYSGQLKIISNFDFRKQNICKSDITSKIYNVRDKGFYVYQPVMINKRSESFHYYSCKQFESSMKAPILESFIQFLKTG